MSAAAVPTVDADIETALLEAFPGSSFVFQATIDQIPTYWISRSDSKEILAFLKNKYEMLFDLSAIDERMRTHREGQPASDFTVIYHLMSLTHRRDIRLKIALTEADLNVASIHQVYPNANWYEREIWDMYGIKFRNHPNLRRILMYEEFKGHPLRKDYPINKRQPLIGPLN